MNCMNTMNGGNHQWWMLRIYISPADNKAARLPNSWLQKAKCFENSGTPQAKLEIIRTNSWYK